MLGLGLVANQAAALWAVLDLEAEPCHLLCHMLYRGVTSTQLVVMLCFWECDTPEIVSIVQSMCRKLRELAVPLALMQTRVQTRTAPAMAVGRTCFTSNEV